MVTTASTFFVNDGKAGIDLTAVNTTPDHPVGTTADGTLASRWTYVYAASTVNQYDVVMIDQSANAVPLTTTNAASSKAIGFAQVAIASASYGWVARQGAGLRANAAANCAPNVYLYTTATAGVMDDAVVSAGCLHGVVAYDTISNATSVRIIASNPHIGFGSNN